MPMVRCPECGRVADGTACYACGYEWPEPSEPPAPAAPPAKAEPPPIEDISMDFDMPSPSSSSSSGNPFTAPRPVTGAFQGPTKPPAENPFASADGGLGEHRPMSDAGIPKATPDAPMAFDPFEGDAAPSEAESPPPPLDLEAEPFGVDVAFDDLDEGASASPSAGGRFAEPTEVLPEQKPAAAPAPEELVDIDDDMDGIDGLDGIDGMEGLDDIDGLDDDLDVDDFDEDVTLDTARSPAASLGDVGASSQEPLSERLFLLAAELDAEGRHDDANLLHEAVRALASHKR